MSYRGAYTTGFMYCTDCSSALKAVLDAAAGGKALSCRVVDEQTVGIRVLGGRVGHIAGDIQGSLEAFVFENLRAQIENVLCHDLTIVVARECGEPVSVIFRSSRKLRGEE